MVDDMKDGENISADTLSPNRTDEEDMRLVTGFADIFAAIGLIGLFFAIAGIGSSALGAASGLLVSAAAWYLSRPMVVSRKFAASGIVLALAFGIGIFATFASIIEVLAPLPAAAGLYVYWRRYRVPISAALILIALVASAALFVVQILEGLFGASNELSAASVAVMSGLAVFALAMKWDMGDRERLTRRSSVAFWLHLCAGPLIAHGTFSLLGFPAFGLGAAFSESDPAIWPVFILFGLFTIIALVIDRRPLLLSSFAYLIYAVGALVFKNMTGEMEYPRSFLWVLVIPLASTGFLVVILAAAWSYLRGLLLQLLPAEITSRVPAASYWTAPVEALQTEKGESEPLRLVLGLNDYLASIGLSTLFLGGIFAGYLAASSLVFSAVREGRVPADFWQIATGWQPWLALAIPMALTLLMAEFFVRRRRMALTAIIAALQFAFLTFLAMLLGLLQTNATVLSAAAENSTAPALSIVPFIFACLVGALMNFAYWRVNRVPISFALGCVLLLPLFFVDMLSAAMGSSQLMPNLPETAVQSRVLIFGILVFAGALAWDRSDPKRATAKADNAFWMHMLASLLVLPNLFGIIASWPMAALVSLWLYAALLLLALVTDRRAPLVVAIPYMLGLVQPPEWLGGGTLIPLLFFGLMVAIVIFWERLRNLLGEFVPILRQGDA